MSADRKPLAFQTPTKQARTVSRTFSMIGRRSKKSAGSRTKRETGWCRISLSEFLFSFVLLFFFFFFGGRGKSDNRRNRLDRGLKGNWLIHDFIFSFCFFLSTRFCRKILRFEYFFLLVRVWREFLYTHSAVSVFYKFFNIWSKCQSIEIY